jgi:hypothetical protein
MDPYAPFTGVLVLPDRAPFGSTSPVSLDDGQPVGCVRWHVWTMRARFDILDPTETATLASGSRIGFWGRRYELVGPRSEPLLELKLGVFGPTGRNTVTLPDGRTLTVTGTWTHVNFAVADATGARVAQIVNTSRFLSLRPDSLALEVRVPVLSVVQAIGLAQCIRAAVEAQRGGAAG